MDIVDREKLGCFPVPMVHTALLFDMRSKLSQLISYKRTPENYEGPKDDIIIMAHNVKAAGTVRFFLLTSK